MNIKKIEGSIKFEFAPFSLIEPMDPANDIEILREGIFQFGLDEDPVLLRPVDHVKVSP